MISATHACGSTPLSFAAAIRVYMTAAFAAALVFAAPVLAQNGMPASPPAQGSQAVTAPGAPGTAADIPPKGSSFTETQARSHLESQGYRRLSNVHADPNSTAIWQADAMKDGQPVRVGIDYRGIVSELGGAAKPPCEARGGAGSGRAGIGFATAGVCAGR